MDYTERIDQLKKRGSVPGLAAIRSLLLELDHPERELPVVHIAGTNGKGSILAYLSSILIEAGYKVGRYLSPTIRCYEERFQMNGKNISREKLQILYEKVGEALERVEKKGRERPTLFEVETALAFLYFKEEKADFALIETGMGGSLDATNVVEQPLLAIISSISFDHRAFLGDTLEEIAKQKAGIIKKGCPVILAENPEEVCRVIEREAVVKKTACHKVCEEDYRVLEETCRGSSFFWQGETFETGLPGRHQISNAVTALEAAKLLLEKPGETRESLLEKTGGKKREELLAIEKRGIAHTRWPGRLEILKQEPLFYRDGAHNPDGACKLAAFLEKHFTNQRIIYIMGVLKDKEYEKMLDVLLPLAKRVYVFRPNNERGLCAKILKEAICKRGVEAVVCPDVRQAVRQAMADASKEDILVACGSLSFMEEMEERL